MSSRLYKRELSEDKKTLKLYIQHTANDSYSRSVDPKATREYKSAWYDFNLQAKSVDVTTERLDGMSVFTYSLTN